MKILIVAATEFEVTPLRKAIGKSKHKISFLITGIGATFTCFALTQELLKNNYHLVLNVGIAGSFSSGIALGTCVQVIEDEFADLAYEEANGDYQTFVKANFIDENIHGLVNGKLYGSPALFKLAQVRGITVNKVHGCSQSIELARNKFEADTESMEGAAVFYVCKQLNVACAQIRSISNFVEPRKREAWDIPLAIARLSQCVSQQIGLLAEPDI